MKNHELTAYESKEYLREGEPSVLNRVRPFFAELITKLKALPEDATVEEKLKLYEECIKKINRFANDIETVEREAILGAIYEIGAIVGLDPESSFAERWRGDW